jgi:hypothetical protein
MNCDQVLQHLTSIEPSSPSGELQEHLDACPSCRDMAELFAPAVQLFGSDSPEEQGNAAASRSCWPEFYEAVALAERSALQLKEHAAPRRSYRAPTRALLQMAAVLTVGLSIGFLTARGGMRYATPSHGSHSSMAGIDATSGTECRHTELIDELLRLHPGQFCTACEPKVSAELASIVTVCMVCHTRAPDSVQARAELPSLF